MKLIYIYKSNNSQVRLKEATDHLEADRNYNYNGDG